MKTSKHIEGDRTNMILSLMEFSARELKAYWIQSNVNQQSTRGHPEALPKSPRNHSKPLQPHPNSSTSQLRVFYSNVKWFMYQTGPLSCISYHLIRSPNSYSSKISSKCTRIDWNTIWLYFASIRMTWLCCSLCQYISHLEFKSYQSCF